MISERVREEVLSRDGHTCQLFHRKPVPATEIAHVRHQGMGGDLPDSEANNPDNLISVCSACHRKLHGPGTPWQIVRWNPGAGELEVVDGEGRRVDHDELWFYSGPKAQAVQECLAQAISEVVNMRKQAWNLAAALDSLATDDTWRLIPDQDAYSLFDLASYYLGLTSSEVRQLLRVYRWAKDGGILDTISWVSPDVADVIRRMDDDGSLLQIASTLPIRELWDEIDRRKQGRKRLRSFVVTEGPVRVVKALSADDVERKDGEKLIRGSLLTGGDDVSDQEEAGQSDNSD